MSQQIFWRLSVHQSFIDLHFWFHNTLVDVATYINLPICGRRRNQVYNPILYYIPYDCGASMQLRGYLGQ